MGEIRHCSDQSETISTCSGDSGERLAWPDTDDEYFYPQQECPPPRCCEQTACLVTLMPSQPANSWSKPKQRWADLADESWSLPCGPSPTVKAASLSGEAPKKPLRPKSSKEIAETTKTSISSAKSSVMPCHGSSAGHEKGDFHRAKKSGPGLATKKAPGRPMMPALPGYEPKMAKPRPGSTGRPFERMQ